MVKLKNIEGVLVEKKEGCEETNDSTCPCVKGFNQAIDQIGEREIRLKALQVCCIVFKTIKDEAIRNGNHVHSHGLSEVCSCNFCHTTWIVGEAIIAKEAEIFEVRK